MPPSSNNCTCVCMAANTFAFDRFLYKHLQNTAYNTMHTNCNLHRVNQKFQEMKICEIVLLMISIIIFALVDFNKRRENFKKRIHFDLNK